MKLTTLLIILSLLVAGCAGRKYTPLPKEDTTTKEIFEQSQREGSNQRYEITERLELSNHVGTSTTARQIQDLNRDFRRVPNPEIVGFVFAHRIGEAPVPGYATVFQLYERDHYSISNESFIPERLESNE